MDLIFSPLLPVCANQLLGLVTFLHFTERQNRNLEAPWLTDLQLTSNQIEQILDIGDQYTEPVEQFRTDILQQEIVMGQMLLENTPKSTLEQQQQVLIGMKLELANVYFDQALEVREVLAPEQLAQDDCQHNLEFVFENHFK